MLDAYMKIDGLKGEPSDNRHPDSMETTTVKLGEKSLSDVADRLGVNHDQLLNANPHIKDPRYLQVGQEVHLPPHPKPNSETNVTDTPTVLHAKDLPKAPLGDPLAATLVKDSLSAKSARLLADNAAIASQRQEAQQKFENAMDAANTEMALGVLSGVAGTSATQSSAGPAIGHKASAQAQQTPEASAEYLIGMAGKLGRGDHNQQLALLADDLAKLKGLDRPGTDASQTQPSNTGTENNPKNAVNQSIGITKFIKP
jgi:LysM domain-containing protein